MKLKITLCLLFLTIRTFTQISQEKLLNSFDTFINAPREVVYAQLNKTTYVKGEALGFTAYLINKGEKTLAKNTTNLYVTISDSINTIIASKLVKVKNGFANNIFALDSGFESGKYTFRAYTNWMLNFKERNYFEQKFKVIDPNLEKEIKVESIVKDYDLSFFPEGGHLISEVFNKIGILVKDENGFGLANAKGKIIDKNNQIVQNFDLNEVGIASVLLKPLKTNSYKIVVEGKNATIEKDIDNIQKVGFNLSLKNLARGKVAIQFRTNTHSSEYLKDKTFYLAIHNGSELKISKFNFKNKLELTKTLKEDFLLKGVNIFTVFDADKGKPILERLYFNRKGVEQVNLKDSKIIEKQKDSLLVEVTLNDSIALEKLQNISISVLPKETKANTINSTILSQFFIEPYVKGFIENPSIYFTENSHKSQQDLDDLLITQGWSSYDWEDIFKKPNYSYRFENGISVKAEIKSKKHRNFLIYPLKNNPLRTFQLEDAQDYFFDNALYPEEGERYKISATKRNRSRKPDLSLAFTPSKVPVFKAKLPSNLFKNMFSKDYENIRIKTEKALPATSLNKVQVLDEVIIASKKEVIRMEKIKVEKAFSKIGFINDSTTELNVEQYLRNRGVEIIRENPSLPPIIKWMGVNGKAENFIGNPKAPILIFDNRIVDTDPEFILNYEMGFIDYIEISRQGIGFDIRGANGVINIVTNPSKRRLTRALNDKSTVFQSQKFPLIFSSPKKFYTPKYEYYNSPFFKAFGTIAWFPKLKANSEGKITFKIPYKYKEDISLFIQGVVNDSSFISDIKTIKL